MPAGNGSARFTMLPRWIESASLAVDEHFDARFVVGRAEPHVIGGALIAEWRRNGAVDNEALVVGEGELQLRQGARPLMAAVRHCDEIGHREMAAAISSVGARRHGCSIGCPHRRCRHGIRTQAALGFGHRRR